MCFRKDELIVPEESDEDEEENDDEDVFKAFNGQENITNTINIKTTEDTHELTEKIEKKIDGVHLSLKQMDRFMYKNLKVIENWFESQNDLTEEGSH